MEELNQHEEQIMSLFWDQGELLIKDVSISFLTRSLFTPPWLLLSEISNERAI